MFKNVIFFIDKQKRKQKKKFLLFLPLVIIYSKTYILQCHLVYIKINRNVVKH